MLEHPPPLAYMALFLIPMVFFWTFSSAPQESMLMETDVREHAGIAGFLSDCSMKSASMDKPVDVGKQFDPSTSDNYAWPVRTAEIAKLIPRGSSVLDLGAGWGGLRNFLSADSNYTAVDLYAEDRGFPLLRCDFNWGQYPINLKNIDVIVVQGLYEYLLDKMLFFRVLKTYNAALILTYHPSHPVQSVWTAPLSEEQLLEIAQLVGFKFSKKMSVPESNGEYIYSFFP